MADEKKDIISEHTSGMTPGEAAGLQEKIKGMEPEEQYSFLCTMFPSLPESILRRVEY